MRWAIQQQTRAGTRCDAVPYSEEVFQRLSTPPADAKICRTKLWASASQVNYLEAHTPAFF